MLVQSGLCVEGSGGVSCGLAGVLVRLVRWRGRSCEWMSRRGGSLRRHRCVSVRVGEVLKLLGGGGGCKKKKAITHTASLRVVRFDMCPE